MATHKADGLYYIDLKLLVKNNACLYSRNAFKRWFGEGRVLATYENTVKAKRRGLSLYWVVITMLDSEKITFEEFCDFQRRYFGLNADMARAFMNLLAVRARREGKL